MRGVEPGGGGLGAVAQRVGGLCVFAGRGARRPTFTSFRAGRYGRAVARARARQEVLPARADFAETVVLEVPAVEGAMAEATQRRSAQ